MRIAIAGVGGRMGKALLLAAAARDCTIVGGTEQPGSEAINQQLGEGIIVPDAARAAAQADVWIDFTTPAASLVALAALSPTPVKAIVLGTTGFTPDQETAIAAFASRFAIVKSGNFSLGVAVLTALAIQAAARLSDWDIEILEAHHRHKKDAPSGTALMLGEAVAEARGMTLPDCRLPPRDGQAGPRPAGGIGFAVLRAGAIVGEHSVILASETETLTLTHAAHDRRIFADGALAAAAWAINQKPGFYGMDDVIGLAHP
jgi:4-hydroxy-tetrahydrodipicolinate reductase